MVFTQDLYEDSALGYMCLYKGTNIPSIITLTPMPMNKTGYRGVYRHATHLRFVAQIRFRKKVFYLGIFNTAEQAAVAYRAAKKMLHLSTLKEFAAEYPQFINTVAELEAALV